MDAQIITNSELVKEALRSQPDAVALAVGWVHGSDGVWRTVINEGATEADYQLALAFIATLDQSADSQAEKERKEIAAFGESLDGYTEKLNAYLKSAPPSNSDDRAALRMAVEYIVGNAPVMKHLIKKYLGAKARG